MHPGNISILDYSYHLPEEKIANFPLAERDASKLLVYREGILSATHYRHIAEWLAADSLLVLNNTQVIEARIIFQKPSGGMIEIFCLEPHERDIQTAMSQKGSGFWKCLIGGASKWKKDMVLKKQIDSGNLSVTLIANYVEKKTDHFIIAFHWTPTFLSFAEMLHHIGSIPLPPYIKRNAEASDVERYQTIYAISEGSVAAPTAGLHFTKHIFNELLEKNIHSDYVTLHVGAGTFKPVKALTMFEHEMHAEYIEVSGKLIQRILNAYGKPIIAVGTTSLRTLESLYWMGVKISLNKQIDLPALEIQQWDPYRLNEVQLSTNEALTNLLNWMEGNKLEKLISKTQLLIAPGYSFKVIDALVTNFHQPQSTLLLLVAALIGPDWKKVYAFALQNDFRFLSYGDGCLLFRI